MPHATLNEEPAPGDPSSSPDDQSESAPALTKQDRQRSRHAGIRDGAFQSIAQGIGEQYFSAFALLLQATPVQLGLLSALPQLVGTWAQLVATSRRAAAYPRRTLIQFGLWSQALWWGPLCAVPLLLEEHAVAVLIALVVVYAGLGHLTVPPWNSLITDAVGPNLRGQYFGHRARIMAVGGFLALGLGSLALQASREWGTDWLGFIAIFAIAALSRGGSAHALRELRESPRRPDQGIRSSVWTFVRQGGTGNFRRFLIFSALMHAATLIAGPFFVMYLLKQLQFSYVEYGLWLAAQILGQFVSLKAWGRLGDRYGHATVLTIAGFLVPSLPILYLFGTSVPYLVGVNFLAGIIWGGLSLAMGNYLFDTVTPEEKAHAVAITSVVNAIGWFAGAMVGGWLVGWLPTRLSVWGVEWVFGSNLPLLFLISGLLRLAVSWSVLPHLHESRPVDQPRLQDLCAALPVIGPFHRLVLRMRRWMAAPPTPS